MPLVEIAHTLPENSGDCGFQELDDTHALCITELRDNKAANIPELGRRLTGAVARYNEQLLAAITQSIEAPPTYCPNTCEVLTTKISIPQEWRAYHAGPITQTFLRASSPFFEDQQLTHHVYFTLNLMDALKYVNGEKDNGLDRRGIFVADLRTVRHARVQTDYQSNVQWNDRIKTLISFYKDPLWIRELEEAKAEIDLSYLSPLKYAPQSTVRNAITSLITGWMDQHTIPFNPHRVSRYRKKRLEYILIEAPIRVKTGEEP